MYRKLTSLIMLYSFIILLISGFALFVSPFGRLSMMLDWHMFGLSKMDHQALHLIFMVLFALAGVLHIVFNFKAIKNYFRKRRMKKWQISKEMLIATTFCGLVFVATVSHIEPLESFVKMNKSFNDFWISQFQKQRGMSQQSIGNMPSNQ